MTFANKKKKQQKQRKPNLIRSEKKNDIKEKFLDSGADQKKANSSPQTKTLNERETERERDRETERRNSKPRMATRRLHFQ